MDFAKELRANTRYPVMRAVVRLWMALAYLVAVMLVLTGLAGFLGGSTAAVGAGGSIFLGVMCFIGAAVAVVLGHLGRELAIMVADIADGVLYIAEQQDRAAPQANQDW